MSTSVKSKFAGFLRGLMGRADDRAPARSVAPTASAPTPVPAPPRTASTPAPVTTTPQAVGSDEIELPLAAIVGCLPLDLRAKLMSTPPAGQTIRLAAEMVIGQLAFGAVKITFGELRHLAPGIFVNSGGELDNKLVNLPLQEILPRLNPALLARRAEKKVEVAEEIVGPFAERGRGFTFTTQPLKAPAAAPAPEPAPEPAPASAASIAFVPPAAVRQVAPAPIASAIPQRIITPSAPANDTHTNGNGNGHGLPLSPLASRSVTPAVNGSNGANGHTNGHGNNGHTNGNGHSNGSSLPPGLRLGSMNGEHPAETPAPLKMSAAPSPVPNMSLPAAPRVAPAQPTIFAHLGDLCENWPESLKGEIMNSPLAQASVPLEGELIVPGLKRGRVTMTWKQLRTLARPSSAPSPNDHLELELPLKVIAPLFLAAQKNPAKSQTKTNVSAEIPDLFFGFPQPAAAAQVIPPLPKPAEQKPQDTNYFAVGDKNEAAPTDDTTLRRAEVPQTDFTSRQAHPKDVAARAAALPGVAGSVVALQDGLRVASEVPADLNADTLAAFLPQIFERVNQSTRELRMGALNNINFTVGNVPWKIFRVNAVYFAAFGKAGEQLPSAQLAQLAAELDRKK